MDFQKKVEAKYRIVAADLLVFVYETLMDSDLWQLVVKKLGDKTGTPDKILGYREISVETNDGPDYHTLVKDPDEEVQGLVYKIKPEGLAKLDLWESQYERKLFLLQSGRKAYVYVLKSESLKDYGKNTSYQAHPAELEEAEKYTALGFPLTPMPIVKNVLEAVKKRLQTGKHEVDSEKLNKYLKKETHGDLMDFARSVIKYFKEGKLEWEEGLGLLQEEYAPKGLDIIPWSFLKRELQFAGPSIEQRLPRALVEKF